MKSHILHPIKKFFVLNLVGISFCLLALRMDGRIIKGIVRFISSSLLKLNVLIKHNICFLMKNVAICNSTCPPTFLFKKFAPISAVRTLILIVLRWNTPYTLSYDISWGILKWGLCIVSFRVFVDYLWELGNTSTTTFLDKNLIARLDLVLPIAWM